MMKHIGTWLMRFAAFGGAITLALTAEKWAELLAPALQGLLA